MSMTAEDQRMEGSGAPDERDGGALVRCDDCGFQWHGTISAHGLRVIGHCPRCQGALRFRDERASVGRLEETAAAENELQPWQVLGTPSSWAR
jgi:hypothetical protein